MDGLLGLSKLPSGLSSMITPPFHLFIINLFPFNKQGNKAIAYEICLYNKIKMDIMRIDVNYDAYKSLADVQIKAYRYTYTCAVVTKTCLRRAQLL